MARRSRSIPAVTFTGTFWDVPGKKHTAVWQFDDLTTGATIVEPVGSKNGTAKGTYTFKDPGVYKVTLKVTDNTGVTSWVDTQDDVESIVVVYDPASGYTIGGGWIDSPLGALVSDPTMMGKMTFGFNSKFFKGATNPKGESQMDFLLGNFEFNALNYEYLVIDKARAQFKGFGKLNGVCGLRLHRDCHRWKFAGGGGVDKFRIKIWEKTTGLIVYDNQMGASDAADPIMAIGLRWRYKHQEVKVYSTTQHTVSLGLTRIADSVPSVIPDLPWPFFTSQTPIPADRFKLQCAGSNDRESFRSIAPFIQQLSFSKLRKTPKRPPFQNKELHVSAPSSKVSLAF